MIFFGTQPTFTHVPPIRPRSINTQRAPYCAARLEVATPPLPPPMVRRSNCSDIANSSGTHKGRQFAAVAGIPQDMRVEASDGDSHTPLQHRARVGMGSMA